MSDDQHRFLALLGQLPARLTAEQVAWVLNCQAGDIPILVMARLLKPLGNPPHILAVVNLRPAEQCESALHSDAPNRKASRAIRVSE